MEYPNEQTGALDVQTDGKKGGFWMLEGAKSLSFVEFGRQLSRCIVNCFIVV